MIKSLPTLLSVGQSLYTLEHFSNGQGFPIFLLSVAAYCLFLTALFLLIIKSDWIAARIVKDAGNLITIEHISASTLQGLAFSCIGILIIQSGITGLVYNVSTLNSIREAAGNNMNLMVMDKVYAGIYSKSIQVIIGLFLFIFPSGLTRLWSNINGTMEKSS